MVREIVTVCVGQAGIQLGETVWHQYCAEYSVSPDGKNAKASDYPLINWVAYMR